MTAITTTCAGCGHEYTIADRYQGRELKCPGCGHPLRIGGSPAPPEPAAALAETVFPEAAPATRSTAAAPEPPADWVEPAEEGALAAAAVYWRVRRLGAFSTAMVSAVVYAMLGLLVGIGVAIASVVFRQPALPVLRGPLFGALAIVAVPLIYAGLGFVLGLVLAALYNLAARLTGGVKILLE